MFGGAQLRVLQSAAVPFLASYGVSFFFRTVQIKAAAETKLKASDVVNSIQ